MGKQIFIYEIAKELLDYTAKQSKIKIIQKVMFLLKSLD